MDSNEYQYDLSIVIPSRNEEFLTNTIEDILKNIRANTEIVVVLDGQWPVCPIKDNPRVKVIFFPESVGQRAATNQGVNIARGRYIMKSDAHCAFDEGFDVKMLEAFKKTGDNVIMAPTMRNLWAFDWACDNGHRRYQSPSGPCLECGAPTHKELKWIAKTNPQSTSYCFDSEPHFQYFNDYKAKQQGDLVESMSLQGSCFMLTQDKYWELNICDEKFGSWGSQGIETAVKFWLSGGRVIINKNTWYGHLFRTQGGDFSFPYPLSSKQVGHAKKMAKDLFFENKWPLQKYPLSWLLEKFWPVRGWNEEEFTEMKRRGEEFYRNSGIVKNNEEEKTPVKNVTAEDLTAAASASADTLSAGILYYTNNKLDPRLMKTAQDCIKKAANGKRIVSVSLLPIDFGDNIVMEGYQSGPLTMFEQILTGLEELDTDIVFFTECDVLYHPSHFDFVPPRKDMYYYNQNCWQVRASDKFAVKYDCKRLSQLCAYRETLIQHYKERIRRCKAEGFSRKMGFEPGSHGRPERVDDIKSEVWESALPNCDIRHDTNMTASRWRQDQFRSQRSCRNWREGTCPAWAEVLI